MQDQGIATLLWRGKWIILACVVVGVALSVVMTKRASKVYEATAVIRVNAGSTTGAGQGLNDVQLANQVLASTYATLISQKGFLEQVQGRVLGGRLSAGELLSRTDASAIPNTALLSLRARGASPDEARQLASDLATAFVGDIKTQAETQSDLQQAQLQSRIGALTRQISQSRSQADIDALRGARSQLQAQLADVVATGIQQGGSATIPAPPTASLTPISPRPVVNVLAGFLLGALAGLGLAWLRARLDRGLHSAQEAEAALDVPVLGTIPVRRRFSTEDPVLAEAFDVLRANLAFISLDRPLQALTITSYNPREGKSSTSEGLALAAARADMSVVLIDADVRTRTLSQRLGHADAPGLTNVVVGAAEVQDVLVELEPGVSLLPAGPTPPNPPSLLGSRQMRELIDTLRGQFSFVLVDSPPVAHLADASILASLCDGIIVVSRVGVTARADLEATAANLRHSPVPVVGAVVLERRQIDETYYPAISREPRQPAGAAETI